MHPDSCEYTAFRCEKGLFEWVVMPMGLTGSPKTFSRVMKKIFKAEIDAGYVALYLDDILTHSATFAEHVQHNLMVLKRLQDRYMKIKLKKCEFFKNKITFLGHEIECGTVKPNSAKVKALKDLPIPTTLKQLQSFLGLANVFKKYIKDYAKHAAPLIKYSQIPASEMYKPKKKNSQEKVRVKNTKYKIQNTMKLSTLTII